MQEDLLWFSLERNCGWDIWSSNLKKSYIFQGACHKTGRVWKMGKMGGRKSFFFFSGLWHTLFHSAVWDFTTKTLGRKEPSSLLQSWYCLGYPAGLLKRSDDRHPVTDVKTSSEIPTANLVCEQRLLWLLCVFIVACQFQTRLCQWRTVNASWENWLLWRTEMENITYSSEVWSAFSRETVIATQGCGDLSCKSL